MIATVRERARRRRGQAVRGRPGHRHPRVPRPAPRRLAPGHAAAAAHRPRGRRARGPRLRAARRPAGAGRAGARAPDHPDRRGAARPPHHRRDRGRARPPAAAAADRQPRSPADAPAGTHAGGAEPVRAGAARADHPRPLASSPPASPRRSCALAARRAGPAAGGGPAGRRCRCSPPPYVGPDPVPAVLHPHARPAPGPGRRQPPGCVLRLQNLSRLPTGTLLLEDRLPYALGSRPRLVLDRLGAAAGQHGGATRSAPTSAAATRSARCVVRLTDPFGLCELTRSFTAVDQLTVIPQVVPRCRRSGWPASTPAAARAGPARWPCTARTTPPPASTATATTCAGCTGARPPGSAS